jgi:hypothetical protein
MQLTPATAGAGAQTTISSQAFSPGGLPVIQLKRRMTTQSNEGLLWVSFTAASTLTLSGYPGFTFMLPSGANTNGTFSLGFYDPTHASLGWQIIAGPTNAVITTVAFSAGTTPVSFAANQTYVFALIETPNAPTPSPTPSPTAGPTPTPEPGSIAQLAGTSYLVTSGNQPGGMVAGPDGNVWFIECPTLFNSESATSGSIVKITTAGAMTVYPLSNTPAVRCPRTIVVGPDGNMWFTEYEESATPPIGMITTSGAITEYPVSAAASGPLTVGSDGNLWFSSAANVYAFNITQHTIVGTATLPGGLTTTDELGSNTTTGEVLVSASVNDQTGWSILSFTPGSAPTMTQRYTASSNAGYASVALGQFAVGTDGNIYGWVFSQQSVDVQELLVLNASTYAATYIPLPTSFIFLTSTLPSDFGPPVTFMNGNLYFVYGDPKSAYRGVVEMTTGGVLLGLSNINIDGGAIHGAWVSGVAGPDGNVWYAVSDELSTEGWVDQITPVGGAVSSSRTRR